MSMELADCKTVFEPFKIKSVESLPMLSYDERLKWIKKVDYNLFNLPARTVTFDFLTDSGTSAMSSTQWAGIMTGDESYAGSTSFERLESTVQKLTSYKHVIPTHQGRAAESLLFKLALKPNQIVIGNTHFDTTRANIEEGGGVAIDLPEDFSSTDIDSPFKGNIDIGKLSNFLKKDAKNVAMIILTVTNNSVGGQPVSMANIAATKEIAASFDIPLYLDCARFAENSYFIKLREPEYKNASVRDIAMKMFSLADGALMSSKKDTFCNIGGFLATNSDQIADKVRTQMVLTEGFPTYGGLAGRDMEALAIGLDEILSENYLSYRLRSTAYLGDGIAAAGFKVIKPFGGHAVYIDAGASLPHIPANEFPGQALAVALYESVGIRSCEVGSVMLGHKDKETGEEHLAPRELVRLAIPRRVYTQSHADYIIEAMTLLHPKVKGLKGCKFKYQAPFLRHFTAQFEPLV